MEINSDCHTIQWIEQNVIEDLVKTKKASKIQDTSPGVHKDLPYPAYQRFFTKKYVPNGQKEHEEEYDYEIRVAGEMGYEPSKVYARLWYDRRTNKAGIKMSTDGFLLIYNSMTASRAIMELGYKLKELAPHGKIDIPLMAKLIAKEISKRDGEANQIEIVKDEKPATILLL